MENIKLPREWSLVKLQEITHVITCGVAARPEYTETGIPFLSAKNVKDGKIIWADYNHISEENHKRLTKINKPEYGDLLYTRVGSFGEATVIEESKEFSIFVSLTLIKPKHELVDCYYLKYLLNSPRIKEIAKNTTRGIGVQNLNVNDVRNFNIVLPPLETQKKIVEVLKKAEKALEKRKKSIKLLDELVKSRFIEMFGDLARNNKEWKEVELSKVCEVIHRYPTFYGMDYIEKGTPVIRIGNILSDGKLENNIENYVFVYDEVNKDFPLTTIELGDILMAVRGDGSAAKRIGIVTTRKLIGANISPNLLRIKAKKSVANNVYLFWYLISDVGQRRLDAYVNKTAKKNIAAKDIKKITTAVPPIDLQNQFAAFVKQADKLKFEMQKSLEEMENNFNSLMQSAFKGELFN